MRIVLGITALGALLAAPLQGQDKVSVITGVVRDAEGKPLAGAEVFAGRSDKPATTTEQGTFRIAPAPTGPLWVSVRRIGYAPVRRSVTISKGEVQTLDFEMEPLPVTLPELKVVERSGFKSRRLEDFWRRSRTGFGGRFVTREEIERRNPIQLSQLVRGHLPFAALARWEVSAWDSEYDFIGFRSAATGVSRRCSPAVSINGNVPLGGWLVDDIPVSEVEAIEIYKPRWSNIPVEYSFHPRAQACGLVVIWQR